MTAKTCIIIPCFNEAVRFKSAEFKDFVDNVSDIDLCFVDDGSTDDTLEKLADLRRICPGRITVIFCPDNGGKAEAVRQGFLYMSFSDKYRWVAFADADLAAPLSEMLRLVGIARQEPEALVVMGSRKKQMEATIRRRFYRHFTGRIFAAVISGLFRLNVYDTQCGAKVFRADVARTVFAQPFLSRWLFDVEMLLRVRSLYMEDERIVREIPLNVWLEQGHSKIRFSHLLKMPGQLCKIYFSYKDRSYREV